MNEIVYPQDQLRPAYQEVVGRTSAVVLPEFLKYGCSLRPVKRTAEVTGKRRERVGRAD